MNSFEVASEPIKLTRLVFWGCILAALGCTEGFGGIRC